MMKIAMSLLSWSLSILLSEAQPRTWPKLSVCISQTSHSFTVKQVDLIEINGPLLTRDFYLLPNVIWERQPCTEMTWGRNSRQVPWRVCAFTQIIGWNQTMKLSNHMDMTMVWSNFCKWIDLSTTWNLWPRYFENVCELDIMLASPATWVQMHWEVALTALSEAVPESEQCINSRHFVKHKSNTAIFLPCTVSSTTAQHKSI